MERMPNDWIGIESRTFGWYMQWAYKLQKKNHLRNDQPSKFSCLTDDEQKKMEEMQNIKKGQK